MSLFNLNHPNFLFWFDLVKLDHFMRMQEKLCLCAQTHLDINQIQLKSKFEIVPKKKIDTLIAPQAILHTQNRYKSH